MKNLTLILISIFLINCSVKNNLKNDLITNNLKGKVKSIKVLQYKAVKTNGIIKKEKFKNTNGAVTVDNFVFFNKQGMITEVQQFISDKLRIKYLYIYDKKMNILKKESYDLKEKLIDVSNYKNTLNSKGEKIEEKEFMTRKGSEKVCIKKIFANQTLIKEITYIDYSNDKIYEIKEYTYDKNENLIKESQNSSDGSIYMKILKEYDENGRIILTMSYNSENELFSKKIYKYLKSDNYNNWTKNIIYENNEPKTIIEREIEYYQ